MIRNRKGMNYAKLIAYFFKQFISKLSSFITQESLQWGVLTDKFANKSMSNVLCLLIFSGGQDNISWEYINHDQQILTLLDARWELLKVSRNDVPRPTRWRILKNRCRTRGIFLLCIFDTFVYMCVNMKTHRRQKYRARAPVMVRSLPGWVVITASWTIRNKAGTSGPGITKWSTRCFLLGKFRHKIFPDTGRTMRRKRASEVIMSHHRFPVHKSVFHRSCSRCALAKFC